MSVIQFRPEDLAREFGAPTPVPVPLGEPISHVQSKSIASTASPGTRAGLWECSPGRWRRQVTQAEFCHVLAGECTFFPDQGAPIEIRAGDVLFFPPDSMGVWDIRQASRKIFIVFDPKTAPETAR
jgi:uncharacterized cupin superfamily protein